MPAFEHITIDVYTHQIETPVGNLEICVVDSSVPLQFSGQESEKMKNIYMLGKTVEPRQPLQLDAKPFCLIIAKCGSCINCYVTAPSTPEEPSFMWSIIEADETREVGTPNVTFGVKTDFCFVGIEASQRLRIEAIPSIDTFYEARDAVDRKRGA